MDDRVIGLRSREPKHAGQASHQAILEAAAGLFGQVPAAAITLRDILSLAGVSNQTLYNYFPQGRDDIAIALYDRYQNLMVEDFKHLAGQVIPSTREDDSQVVRHLSAALARAIFGLLGSSRDTLAALAEYLKAHHLLQEATHTRELEEALARELELRLGKRFAPGKGPRLVRLTVKVSREVGLQAVMERSEALEELESLARKLARAVLNTGLRHQEAPSGVHAFQPRVAPHPLVAARLSPAKRKGILDRILKRKG